MRLLVIFSALFFIGCGSSGGGGGGGGGTSPTDTSAPSSGNDSSSDGASSESTTGTVISPGELVLLFTSSPANVTTDSSLGWTIYGPEIHTYTCSINSSPVSCTRVNSYTLNYSYSTSSTGYITFEITGTALDGRVKTLTHTIRRDAPAVAGPTLTFTYGPRNPGVQTVVNTRSYTFEVYSSKPLAASGLSCTMDGNNIPCSAISSSQITTNGTVGSDGLHTIYVTAQSTDGGQSTVSASYTVDTTAPTISVPTPPSASIVANASNNTCVTITPYIPASDKAGWRYRTNGGAWTATSGSSANVCHAYGTYTTELQAYDTVGNYSTSTNVSYEIVPRFTSSLLGSITVYKPHSSIGGYWITENFSAVTWNDANNGCNNLNIGGYSGWYLPSSILAADYWSKGIASYVPYTDVSIWTSTDAVTNGYKISRNLYTGASINMANNTVSTAYVRCVRLAP